MLIKTCLKVTEKNLSQRDIHRIAAVAPSLTGTRFNATSDAHSKLTPADVPHSASHTGTHV